MPPTRLPMLGQMTTYANSLRLNDRIAGVVARLSLPAQAVTNLLGHGKRLIDYLKQPSEFIETGLY